MNSVNNTVKFPYQKRQSGWGRGALTVNAVKVARKLQGDLELNVKRMSSVQTGNCLIEVLHYHIFIITNIIIIVIIIIMLLQDTTSIQRQLVGDKGTTQKFKFQFLEMAQQLVWFSFITCMVMPQGLLMFTAEMSWFSVYLGTKETLGYEQGKQFICDTV